MKMFGGEWWMEEEKERWRTNRIFWKQKRVKKMTVMKNSSWKMKMRMTWLVFVSLSVMTKRVMKTKKTTVNCMTPMDNPLDHLILPRKKTVTKRAQMERLPLQRREKREDQEKMQRRREVSFLCL